MKKKIVKIEIKPVLAGNPGVTVYDVILYDAFEKAQSDSGNPGGYWSKRITFFSQETLKAFLDGLRICRAVIGGDARADIKIPSLIPK